MSIIQVVQHLSPGGIEVMAIELKKHFKHIDDNRTLIISLEGNRDNFIRRWPKLEAIADDIIFMDKKPGFSLWLILRLLIVFIKHKAKVVHTHHIGPLIYAGLAARLGFIGTLVHTEHDAWHLENRKRQKLQSLIIRITQPNLVADADTVAIKLKEYIDHADVNVIKNGIDINHFVPGDKVEARIKMGLPKDKFIVGCCGRLEKVKGHANLIKAAASLPNNVHIALAGDGRLKGQLQALALSLGIEDRVHFLGHKEDMPSFYQSLDVFCLPSLKEGMPLAPLEAQACNIPAVVSHVGATEEALCQQSGNLVKPGNHSELIAILKTISKAKPLSSPRAFVEKHGNMMQTAQQYLCLYRGQAYQPENTL